MFSARPMAKVNLTLEVVGRRPDGFHELRSVFLRIALTDSLSVTATGSADTLTIQGLPCPTQGNLVLEAIASLRRRVDVELPGLAAELDKQIPLGAGLGGGSSDAAAALELAAAAWGVGLAPDVRAELALDLGSDVPFFAAGAPAALVKGRGEHVQALPAVRGDVGILLALSGSELSTARVFQRYDELVTDRATDGPTDRPTDQMAAAFRAGVTGPELAQLAEKYADANDLWPSASSLDPELVERRGALERATQRRWLLSGSGPSLFAIYPSLAQATDAGRALASPRVAGLASVMLCATDVDNPDNTWRN
jgi:4-diphosphocytidyl-2-C-methyl-D-erythritol kinase